MTDLTLRLKKALEFDVKPAHREICDLAASGGRERWRMSIPVRPDDSDMVLQEPLDHIARTKTLMLALVDMLEFVDEKSCAHDCYFEGRHPRCKQCNTIAAVLKELERLEK